MDNDMKGLGRIWKQPRKQNIYSDGDAMKILDSVAFPKGLTIFQMLKVLYWALFERHKLDKFCESINKGKSLYFSLKDASKI